MIQILQSKRSRVARAQLIGTAAVLIACTACSQTRSFHAIDNASNLAPPDATQRVSSSPNSAEASGEQTLRANYYPTEHDDQPSLTPLPPLLKSSIGQSETAADVSFESPIHPPDELPSVVSAPAGIPAMDVEPPSFRKHFREDLHELWPEILQDHRNYYSLENAARLATGFGVGAVLANTDVDQKIRDWYQQDVRSKGSDDIAHVAKKFGEGAYVIPAMAAGWLVGEAFYDARAGDALDEWGQRSLRSAIVGTPPMLLMQYVTGGSRPVDPNPHSDWRPFSDNNGVSGHSFICALPFINAAKMTDEWPLKMGFYACSTLGGWSRINDDAHYTSQVVLGWWMAYCAATAVDETGPKDQHWTVTPLPITDGAGMALTYQY